MRAGERVCLAGGVALLVLMFVTQWYGAVELPRHALTAAPPTATGPWSQLRLLRWLMLITALAGIALPGVGLVRRSRYALPAGRVIMVLAVLTSLALFYRVLINPPSAAAIDDVKLGAYLALLSAVAIALGAAETSTLRR